MFGSLINVLISSPLPGGEVNPIWTPWALRDESCSGVWCNPPKIPTSGPIRIPSSRTVRVRPTATRTRRRTRTSLDGPEIFIRSLYYCNFLYHFHYMTLTSSVHLQVCVHLILKFLQLRISVEIVLPEELLPPARHRQSCREVEEVIRQTAHGSWPGRPRSAPSTLTPPTWRFSSSPSTNGVTTPHTRR